MKGIGLGATASTLLFGLAISMSAAAAYGINYAVAEFASTVYPVTSAISNVLFTLFCYVTAILG